MKLVLLWFVLLLAVPVLAQDESPDRGPAPLLFYGDGFYIMEDVSAEPERWTDCGISYFPRISPDGNWVASPHGDAGLRLCHLYTRKVRTASAPSGGEEAAYYTRVTWSPDSSEIAWIISAEDGVHQLAVYNLEAEESRLLVDALPADRRPYQILWGESGILVVSSGTGGDQATLYDTEGEILFEDLSGGIDFAQYFWATDSDGKEWMGRYPNFWQGEIIDPETGRPWFAEGIEMYSPLAPEGFALYFENFEWFMARSGEEPVAIRGLGQYTGDFVPYFQFDPHNVAISPDGEAFMIYDLDQLVWHDGEVTALPDGLPRRDGVGAVWGPMRYRITGEVYNGAG